MKAFARQRRLRTALALAAFACGCAGTQAPPPWASGPDPRYPGSRYLTAVGTGESLESASARALGAMAQIFHSRVEQRIDDREGMRRLDGLTSEHQQIEVETKIRSEEGLEGVQIAESWRDPDGRVHALAVLSRGAARSALVDRLTGLEHTLLEELAGASATAGTFARLQSMKPALERARQRDRLADRLRVLAAERWPARPETEAILAEQRRLRDSLRLRIELRVRGGAPGEAEPIRSALVGMVRDAGLRLSADEAAGEPETTWLRCNVDLSPPFERGGGGWVHHTWTATSELTDAMDAGRPVLSHAASGSASHPEASLSRQIALQRAGERIARDLAHLMAGGIADGRDGASGLEDGLTR